ncbi:hypothetical protein ACROYT_G027007 [Oculina patagonica]
MSGVRLITCIVTCQDDPRCYSLNFKFTLNLCELNSETRISVEPKNFVSSGDTIYLDNLYRPYRPCENVPCKNGGTCVTTNLYPGFKCECKAGYIGPACEDCLDSLMQYQPLGMQNGKILDSQITASSQVTGFEAFKARLYGSSCWKSAKNSSGEFLEINFREKEYVKAIKTQGDPQEDNWTEQFYVAFTLGSVWENVTWPYHGVKKFKGNRDRNHYIIHYLRKQSFRATSVRIYPLKWHGNMALRLELYSC